MELKKAIYASPGTAGAKGFEDLECYQLALDVVVNVYEVVNLLPSEEKQGLAQKLRHAIQSVPANIAEGYGRYHYLDSLRFYSCARGALNKSLSYFITARALNYIDQSYFDALYHLARRAERALNGYMNYVRKQRTGADLYGTQCLRKEIVEYVIQEEVG